MKTCKNYLTKSFLFIACFLLSTSCKTDEEIGDIKSQLGLYTLVFTESNNNVGVAVIAVLKVGEKIDVDNFIFRYNEKDESKVREICFKFNQAIVDKDSVVIQNQTLGDCIQSYFSKQDKFNVNFKLNKNQLQNLINKKDFSLAFAQNKTDENLLATILNAFIPSANAQVGDKGTAIVKSFAAVLLTALSSTAIIGLRSAIPSLLPAAFLAAPFITTTLVVGAAAAGGAYLLSEALDTPVAKGVSSPINSLTTIVNGSQKLFDDLNKIFVEDILFGLNSNYTDETKIGRSEKLNGVLDKFINSSNSYSFKGTTQEVTGINTDPECNCTIQTPVVLTFVAKSTSASNQVQHSSNVYTGILIGTHKNLSLSNFEVLKNYKELRFGETTKIPAKGYLMGGNGVGEFKIGILPNRTGTYYYRTVTYYVYTQFLNQKPMKIVVPDYGEEKSFTIAPLG